MWFLFALIFALVSSMGVIIAKKVMQASDEYFFLFVSGLFALPFLFLIVLIFYQIPRIDSTFVLSLVASSSIGVLAAILAYRAIKIADVSLVAPLAAFNPVFTAILSLLFLGEVIALKGWLGILLIVVGSYLLGLSGVKAGFLAPVKTLYKNSGVRYSVAAYLLWAITPVFEKTAILHTEPQVPPFASLFGMVITTLAFALLLPRFSKTRNLVKVFKRFLPILLFAGLLGGIGQASAFIAFSLTNLGFVTAVFRLSMIFTVILGWVFFKEVNVKDKLLGSLVMLVGVFLLVS